MTRSAVSLLVSFAMALAIVGVAHAQTPPPHSASTILDGLGFSLSGVTTGVDKNAISWTRKGLLVPTPWGDFEATIVNTPTDRMVRVPLSPNTDSTPGWLRPYVTAGARKNVDEDPVLDQARSAAFGGEAGRGANLKAGAGVIFKLDGNIELFGEYQFMRLSREPEGRGSLPIGTTLDASGFSLGISVRY